MEFVEVAGTQWSRLMLGTVQFGMPYGIANTAGQPDFKDVKKMLCAACDAGVTVLDTAAAYGSSEEVLGRALEETGLQDRMTVVTKVRALTPEDTASPQSAEKAIVDSVRNSLERLRMDVLPLVLMHREADYAHLSVLEALRGRGWVRGLGVSCDNRPGPASEIVADDRVSAMQLPANILDHRHAGSGVFRTARDRGVAVFIRSVYLQGLLLMPADQVPQGLAAVLPVRQKLEALAAKSGLSMPEMSLRYMLSQEGVTSVLTGVETLAQLRENVAMAERGALPSDLLTAIDAAVPALPEDVLTPWMWPRIIG